MNSKANYFWAWIKLFVHCGIRQHKFMRAIDEKGKVHMLACDNCAQITWTNIS